MFLWQWVKGNSEKNRKYASDISSILYTVVVWYDNVIFTILNSQTFRDNRGLSSIDMLIAQFEKNLKLHIF